MYLSYLMGAPRISDEDLARHHITIAEKTTDGKRALKIPNESLEGYKQLVREKLENGFWNEYIGEHDIGFIFKLATGEVLEYILSETTEREIDLLCAKLNNETPDKTANVYKYLADNDFYRDFLSTYYAEMIHRN